MPTATLTSKGQITIPRQVRDELQLAEGDKLEFLIEENGIVRLRRLSASVKDVHGFLKRPGQRAVSVEEMNQAIADHLTDEDRRTRSGR
jgi:antitoxin PrlF